ncbi:MAG: methyltransferase [Deltaproteobacteria bacterium]
MNLISRAADLESFGDWRASLGDLNSSLTASSELTAEGTNAIENLSAAYVVEAFEKLGWQWQVGRRFTAWELMRELGILPRYDRLVLRLLRKFEEDGVVARSGIHWVIGAPPKAPSPEQLLAAGERNPQGQQTVLAVLRACAPSFADALTGRRSALEVIFPNGDSSLVGAIYNEHPASHIMNRLVRHAFEQALPLGERRPHVLEAGAGTGGTTAYLVDILDRRRCDYVFTDVSPFFLNAARAKFAGALGMRFSTLNLDLPPDSQGIQAHWFDVIVAANMLHACRTVTGALGGVRRMLRPGGVLLLLETTRAMRWLDLIFGLTDGWWAFSDCRLRSDYPLLSASSWLGLLPECGFGRSFVIDNALANQSLFVCRADESA